MFGELAVGTRPVGRPKLAVQSILKAGGFLESWHEVVDDRQK
jgi:hypothetical protein